MKTILKTARKITYFSSNLTKKIFYLIKFFFLIYYILGAVLRAHK